MTFKRYNFEPGFKLCKYRTEHNHELNEVPCIKPREPNSKDRNLSKYFLRKAKKMEMEAEALKNKKEKEYSLP